MLDDLDLAWEEQYQEPRRRRGAPQSRQARARRRRERKRRRRSYGALFISLLLLASLGVGVYWGVGKLQEMFGAPDYEVSRNEVKVSVVIESGDTGYVIAQKLYEKRVIKSVRAFLAAWDAEPRSQTIQPGTYSLFEEMRAADALAMLLEPEKYMVVEKVTIREGLTAIQTFQKLSEATGIPVEEFKKAAKDPVALGVPEFWFSGERADDRESANTIEGFLFPDTYSFSPDATAEEILKTMVQRFNSVVEDLGFVETVQSQLGITPYEALIVASLAQVEVAREEDLPKVARVAYNRTFKEMIACRCLQFDVTVNYWLEQQGKKTKSSAQMTSAELDNPKNPWNTGPSSPGLPAGPISNPGKAALEGAMNPASGNWLYFVAVDKEGTTKFASTLAEHRRNEQEACRNGVISC